MAQNINDMKANSKKGMARKGSMRRTRITFINFGVASDANQKVTKTVVEFRLNRYEDIFTNKLNHYFPINKYGSHDEQLKAYRQARFIQKQQHIIRAFSSC